MFLDFLLFPIFLCFIYTIGAGVLMVASQGKAEQYPDYFQLITGLLTIGFISVLVNFHSAVATPITYLLIAGIFTIGVFPIVKIGIKQLKYVVVFGLALVPLAAGMNDGYDTGLYHLPHQLWIRDEKIIFGLANFHGRFGFSSIMEYINAPLWVGNNFKLLAYSEASFVVIILLFIKGLANSKNYKSALVGLLLAVSLLLYSVQMKMDYTSTDIPTGILFAISFFYGLQLLLKNEIVSSKRLTILFVYGLFTCLLKVSGALILLWILLVIAYLMRAKLVTLKTIALSAILPIILGIIWLVRSVIVSGCLLYPVLQTCLDLPWTAKYNAENDAKWVTAWARQPKVELSTLENWNWLSDWWLEQHGIFLIAMVFMSFAVLFAYRFFYRDKPIYLNSIMLPALAFVVLSLGVWFIKAPDPRFGIGAFIIFPSVLALTLFGFRQAKNTQLMHKITKICLIALVLAFSILGVVKGQHTLAFNPLTVPELATISADNFGVNPAEQGVYQCWLAKNCSPSGKAILIEQNGIKMFPSVKAP